MNILFFLKQIGWSEHIDMAQIKSKEHFPIEAPTLPATIVARMNERDYTQKDLAALLGISAPRLCKPVIESASFCHRSIPARLNSRYGMGLCLALTDNKD